MNQPTFILPSPEIGTDYWIQVHVPEESGPWPAVAFMDGDDQFAAAIAGYAAARKAGHVPPLLLVGVGYGASYRSPANQRGRDYTPVAHSDEPSSGGGEVFLHFLTDTLWPELGKRYPVDARVSGVAGHSLGSLLALHALFRPKPFFTHFLASAPSIWWAERAMLRQVVELRTHQATLAGRLFLGAGTEDSASMSGDLALLEKQLAEQPFRELTVVSRRFPRKNHFNVLPVAFETGLADLFGD